MAEKFEWKPRTRIFGIYTWVRGEMSTVLLMDTDLAYVVEYAMTLGDDSQGFRTYVARWLVGEPNSKRVLVEIVAGEVRSDYRWEDDVLINQPPVAATK